MCFKESLPFPPSFQEKQVLTRVNQEKIGWRKVELTSIKSILELFGNKENLFQLKNESATPMEECHF